MKKIFFIWICSLLFFFSRLNFAKSLQKIDSSLALKKDAAYVQREELFRMLKLHHRLSDEQLNKVKNIFKDSRYIGTGNISVTKHPMSCEECRKKLEKEKIDYKNSSFESICGSSYMAPLYDPSREKPEAARVCIDQFEFPDIPCEYPVIWVRAREAAQICEAIGKRLCDAHEWEGACAGELHDPGYRFDLIKKGMTVGQIHRTLRNSHNRGREIKWSYGKKQNHSLCGTNSTKGSECNKALSSGKGVWASCGSNTYPTGAFPKCKSALGVYDIHGNAAEHMNLPFNKGEFSRDGKYGYTEMKGSWFIFSKFSAHRDDCRWRAPYWHGSKVMSSHSHRNYHLGFRCCKDIKK